jgi:hypothetical protein
MAGTTEDMEQRREILANHIVVITDEVPMEVQSKEEVNTSSYIILIYVSMSFMCTEATWSRSFQFSLKVMPEMLCLLLEG